MDILIKDVSLLTPGQQNGVEYIERCDIGICNDKIIFIKAKNDAQTGLGKGALPEASNDSLKSENLKHFNPDIIIDGKNKLAVPGLVNAHTHSAMTILRNYADDLPLKQWLFEKILPVENLLSDEDIYWGAKLAIAEMIMSGTTCFADMYMFMDMVAQAVAESGIKANLCRNPLKNPGNSVPLEHFGDTRYFEFYWKWNGQAGGRIKVFVEVHSTYLYDEPSLREASELARNFSTGIHIHLLETKDEILQSYEQYRKNPVDVCIETGIFSVPVIAAHCVHLSDEDIDKISRFNIAVAHNPTSNLKLASGIARINDIMKKGINVCLGTDGTASNNNLNMFEEMHIASLIHKGVNQDAECVNAETVFRMATINGSKALGFDDAGALEEGKKADVVLLNKTGLHLRPFNNPLSAVAYSFQASDADTVIVDGQILMQNREIKTIDVERTLYEVEKTAKKIGANYGN